MRLEDLVRRHEGKTLEYKRDLSAAEGILRTVCAFANTAGGMLVLGVEDRSRRIIGLEDPLKEEERLINLVAENVRPQLAPDVEMMAWKGRTVLVATIYPGPTRPYYLKSLGTQAGTFVRIGSTNRLASQETLAELRRTSVNMTFDEQPMPQLDTKAIDFVAAAEMFAEFRRLRRRDLLTLRVLAKVGHREVPTMGGILLFGRDRHAHFPDAWLQVACFAGNDRTEILDMAELRGLFPAAIDQAMAFVRRNTAQRSVIRAARREEHPTYPPVALREAVVNAVVHCDFAQRGSPIRIAVYADRVEVENPGLLAPGLTMDDIRQGVSKLRNRVVGRVFHELRLIEQWGSGIQRMLAACRSAGLPEPEFEEIGERFRVTLRALAGARPPAIDAVDARILRLLGKGDGLATAALARELDLTNRAVQGRLRRLVERGLVVEIATGPNDPRRRYRTAMRG